MWELFGNHIVGFPTRRLISIEYDVAAVGGTVITSKCILQHLYFAMFC